MNKGSIVERLCSDLIAMNRDVNGLLLSDSIELNRLVRERLFGRCSVNNVKLMWTDSEIIVDRHCSIGNTTWQWFVLSRRCRPERWRRRRRSVFNLIAVMVRFDR